MDLMNLFFEGRAILGVYQITSEFLLLLIVPQKTKNIFW